MLRIRIDLLSYNWVMMHVLLQHVFANISWMMSPMMKHISTPNPYYWSTVQLFNNGRLPPISIDRHSSSDIRSNISPTSDQTRVWRWLLRRSTHQVSWPSPRRSWLLNDTLKRQNKASIDIKHATSINNSSALRHHTAYSSVEEAYSDEHDWCCFAAAEADYFRRTEALWYKPSIDCIFKPSIKTKEKSPNQLQQHYQVITIICNPINSAFNAIQKVTQGLWMEESYMSLEKTLEASFQWLMEPKHFSATDPPCRQPSIDKWPTQRIDWRYTSIGKIWIQRRLANRRYICPPSIDRVPPMPIDGHVEYGRLS